MSQDIIDEDHGYAGDVKRADGTLKAAKQKRADALAELNQFRWEMTVCEFGPQFSQREYADAVGQSQMTIQRGVTAWQATLDADKSNQNGSVCCYGAEPHHLPDVEVVPDKTAPTEEQSAKHAEERRIADNGEIKAAAIVFIAAHFQVAENTVERHYRPLLKEAIARLNADHVVSDLTIEEVNPLLNEIARVLRAEDKLRQRREGEVKRWMADNRGVSVNEITAKDVQSKMDRIESVVAKKEISWDDAAIEVRAWDEKTSAAAKMKNQIAAAARQAILDLMLASSEVKGAAMRVTKAVQAIEDSEIVITDDERDMSVDDLNQAEAAIHLARAALTGDSGTDWDAAMAALNGGDES